MDNLFSLLFVKNFSQLNESMNCIIASVVNNIIDSVMTLKISLTSIPVAVNPSKIKIGNVT